MNSKELKNKIIEFLGLKNKNLKTELKKTSKFFIAFLLILSTLNIILSFIPVIYLEILTAIPVKLLLALQGITSTETITNDLLMHLSIGKTIIISYLCTGMLELTIIEALILGSIGIKLKKRIIGGLIVIPATYFFNVLRIYITINTINSLNTTTVNLIHNVLFRITLFIVIAGFYYAWFKWAIKNESKTSKTQKPKIQIQKQNKIKKTIQKKLKIQRKTKLN